VGEIFQLDISDESTQQASVRSARFLTIVAQAALVALKPISSHGS
jgi:hypothetical protein